jgi:hypothetical protein
MQAHHSEQVLHTPPKLQRSMRRRLLLPLPHDGVDERNQLLRYETRNLPSKRQLWAVTLLWMLGVAATALAPWLIYAALVILFPNTFIGGHSFVWGLIVALAGMTAAGKFLLDFVGIQSALTTYMRDMNHGRWDLICVSNIDARDVVQAKHAVAQLRLWRLMSGISGLHLAVALLVVLHTVVLPQLAGSPEAWSGAANPLSDFYTWLVSERASDTVDVLLLSVATGLLMLVYVVEPLWRLRVLTAVSLAAAAPRSDSSVSMTVGAVALFAFWGLQLAIGAFAFATITSLAFIVFPFITIRYTLSIVMVLYAIVCGMVVYYGYDMVAGIALDLGRRLAERLGATRS